MEVAPVTSLTVRMDVPETALNSAVITAWSCVALTAPVSSGEPDHFTTESGAKPVPVTLSRKEDPPASIGLGVADAIAGVVRMPNGSEPERLPSKDRTWIVAALATASASAGMTAVRVAELT